MKTLEAFRGIHQGQTIVVCGCGISLDDFKDPERFITIGVNDIGRRFQPNYLVVVNGRQQFWGDRFYYVEHSEAEAVFTHLNLEIPHAQVVKFRLGRYEGTDFDDPTVLHYTKNSPYVAMCLAVHMGAKRIGVIGVDFTDHHFFKRTGTHHLSTNLATINQQYGRLDEALRRQGIEIFNISKHSRLTVLSKMPLDEFSGLTGVDGVPSRKRVGVSKRSALKIISYATTPLAGVPAILARCINAATPHECRCVWQHRGYSNGIFFEGDIEWPESPTEAEAVISNADIVIVHNGKIDARHHRLLSGKAIITMAHNYMWNVDPYLVSRGFPGAVVGQYQATLPEFVGWDVVPNPIPLWEDAYQPARKGDRVTICYTPSGRHERYRPGHRLYWHGKGYDTTVAVLERLARLHSLELEVVRARQVTHAAALAMKARAHIVIDECVTGSYHRNSLEGLAAGAVVVNGVGLRPEIVAVFKRCVGGDVPIPFECTDLEGLEVRLDELIRRGSVTLARDGAKNRKWLEDHWDFARQWQVFWQPIVDRAMDHANRSSGGAALKTQCAVPPHTPTRPAAP
ncbi:hypothetical protein MYX75_02285 [Acidobacteria bacterium AH-259-A15]|nr:hypothetical protein [Acidobacteria bacterium AH-259-A15]